MDHYSVYARERACALVLLPVAAGIVLLFPSIHSVVGTLSTLCVSFGLLFLISTKVSSMGNKVQERLFKKWKGSPSVQIMRWSNPILDAYSKDRYHRFLERSLQVSMPSKEDETISPIDADEKYKSATAFLREATRDKKAYPIVYAELIRYGFVRNLLALKPVALIGQTIFLVISITYFNLATLSNLNTSNFFKSPRYYVGLFAVLICTLSIAGWFLLVTESLVESRGFYYARALLNSIDRILNTQAKLAQPQ